MSSDDSALLSFFLQGAAFVTTLRTGGSIPLVSKEGMSKSQPSVADAPGA